MRGWRPPMSYMTNATKAETGGLVGHESKRRHVDSYLVAALYVQLGGERARPRWLERGFEQHSPHYARP